MKLLLSMMLGGAIIIYAIFALENDLPVSDKHKLFILFMGAFGGFAFWSRMGKLSPLLEELKNRFPRDDNKP